MAYVVDINSAELVGIKILVLNNPQFFLVAVSLLLYFTESYGSPN